MKMKHKYDMAAKYHEMQGAEHSDNNRFVDRRQSVLKALGGKEPRMAAKYTYYDAEMTNNGMSAKSFARTLTKGMDKKAYPVD